MRRKKPYGKRALALCLALLLCIGTGGLVAAAKKADVKKAESASEKTELQETEARAKEVRATLGGERIADENTMTTWEAIAKQSTQHTGRIWTDKSVFTEGATLPGSGEAEGGEDIVVEQGDSDFLVGLSALSSTSNMTTQSAKPLDIVLVLDTSGSMGDAMDGSQNFYKEIYAGELDQNKTYYIRGGLMGYREVHYDSDRGEWGYQSLIRWNSVDPKTGPNDRGDQFYIEEGSRLHNLQTAVNQFIDATAAANADIKGDEKHQLSIVTYAGNADTEENLQEVTETTANSLKDTVNRLQASGATNAGAGMEYANTELTSDRARENAQQVVIFFTDGTPTTTSSFSETVANRAVRAAGEIKSEERGGLVYSIGIFEGADPDDTSRDNQFMNAVSSNYPNATAYNQRGERVDEKYQYYKTAQEAGKLNEVFTEIFEEIKNPGSYPTATGSGDPMNDGYITIEDTLGAYMEVDSFNEIVFADRSWKLDSKDENGNIDTYRFQGSVDAGLYPGANLSEIEITVERSEELAEGDKVTVKIPAALIPLRKFDVQQTEAESGEYTTTVSNTYPMRIFFGVSVKEEAALMLENPDKDMKAYIEANTVDGKVNFYSNDFVKGAEYGNTTATFTPAESNSFYYFGQDSVLYINENCTQEANTQNSGNRVIDESNPYWYQRTYYEEGNPFPMVENVQITGPLAAELLDYARLNAERQWYIPAEAPRLATIHNTHLEKNLNVTGTAADVIDPQWKRNENNQVTNNVVVYLGNNGRLTMDVPGILEVSKAVTAEEGLDAPDKDFTFAIDLTAAQGAELKDSYTAQRFDKDGQKSGDEFQVADGETVKLKAGEKVQVYGIAAGTEYVVTEQDLPEGFTQTAPADDAPVSGVMGVDADNGINKAAFTNHYAVTELEIKSVDFGLSGSKKITGRDFEAGDIFRFEISASQVAQNSPLPIDGGDKDTIQPTSGSEEPIGFGDFVFEEPGHYRYSIKEYLPNGTNVAADPADKIIPGMTYDGSEYRLVIDVADDHNGGLMLTSVEIDKRDDQTGGGWTNLYRSKSENGQPAKLPGANEKLLEFTNVWSAEEQGIHIAGRKELQGKSLSDYTTKETFGFALEKAGSRETGVGDFEEDPDQPMPTVPDPAKPDRWIYRNSPTGDITIPEIPFKTENIGKEYKYIVRELQPTDTGKVDGTGIEGATQNDAGKWVYKGITFDDSLKEITIKVMDTAEGTTAKVQAEVSGNDFVFTNSYDASTTYDLAGTKKITGREFKNGDTFTFNIEARNGAPLPDQAAGGSVTINPTSGEEEAINFGTITFTQADMRGATVEKNDDGSTKQYTKDFTYILTETETGAGGMKYDTKQRTVVITVTDDNHGKMTAELKSSQEDLVWTNTYTATGVVADADLEVTKVLRGRTMNAGEFHFTIRNADGTEALMRSFTNVRAAENSVQTLNDGFAPKFDQADIGKTFTYIVDETEDQDKDGITYDKSQYRVDITPKDNGDGTIKPEITVTQIKDKDGNDTDTPVPLIGGKAVIPFENTYSTTPATVDLSTGFTKAITGRDWAAGDTFGFQITGTADDGGTVPMPQETTVTVDHAMAEGQDTTAEGAKTTFGFGETTFDREGTYTYTVAEDKAGTTEKGLTYSNNKATVRVVVEDKEGTGTLTATPTITNPDFVNVYEATLNYAEKGNIAIFKTLHGTNIKDRQFSFTITPKDQETADRFEVPLEGVTEESKPAEEGVRKEVGSLTPITFNQADAGQTYAFTVQEQNDGKTGFEYDDTVYDVSIAITDNGEGELQAVTTVLKDGAAYKEEIWTSNSAPAAEKIPLDFENYYNALGTVDVAVKKTVTGGRPLRDGEFTFFLTTKPNNNGVTGTQVAAANNDANGNVSFGTLTYTTSSEGTGAQGAVNLTEIITGDAAYATKKTEGGKDVYTVNYTVSEDTSKLPGGMSATTQPFDVTVTVTDNGDGTLTAVSTTGEFVNTYATTEDKIPMKMNGSKTLSTNGVTGLVPPALKDNFSFELTALTEGAPLPANTTAVTDENGNIDFGEAEFAATLLADVTPAEDGSRTKVFEYQVEEIVGTLPGVTYDTTPKNFTITLKDDGNGNLTATSSAEGIQPLFSFTNTYSVTEIPVSVTDQIQIRKVLDGRAMKDKEFTFQLIENVNGTDTVVATGSNDVNGNVVFDAVTYSEPGDHTYTVREQIPENAANNKYEGVTYDTTEYTIQTSVKDNGDGTLTVEHTVDGGADIRFENKYEAGSTSVVLNASKKLVNKKLEDGQFTFELRDKDDKLVGEAKKNDANGQVKFDAISYDQEGVYEYTIREINDKQEKITYDEKVYSVTVNVKDGGKGTYVAEVSYPDGAPSFVNTYEKPEEPGTGGSGNGGDDGTAVPKTGDTAQIGAWIVLMAASLLGAGALIVIKMQKRRRRR